MKKYPLDIHHFHLYTSGNACSLKQVWNRWRQIFLYFCFLLLVTCIVFCQVWINVIGLKTIQRFFLSHFYICYKTLVLFSCSWESQFFIRYYRIMCKRYTCLDMWMQIMHRECRGERKVKGNFQEKHLSRMCCGVTEGSARLVRGGEATKEEMGPETTQWILKLDGQVEKTPSGRMLTEQGRPFRPWRPRDWLICFRCTHQGGQLCITQQLR